MEHKTVLSIPPDRLWKGLIGDSPCFLLILLSFSLIMSSILPVENLDIAAAAAGKVVLEN